MKRYLCVPQIGKEDRVSDDDCAVQLNHPSGKNRFQPIWFSMYLTTEQESPKCMTVKLQKARAPQRYTKAPQEVYSILASYTCLIHIYRDMMAESPHLQQVRTIREMKASI